MQRREIMLYICGALLLCGVVYALVSVYVYSNSDEFTRRRCAAACDPEACIRLMESTQ